LDKNNQKQRAKRQIKHKINAQRLLNILAMHKLISVIDNFLYVMINFNLPLKKIDETNHLKS